MKTIINRYKTLLARVRVRKTYATRFKNYLHAQARLLHIPVAVVCFFAWMGFAFETDGKLHPEFPELFYFRIGLTIIASFLGLAIISDALGLTKNLRGEGHTWLYLTTAYLVLATSAFTGPIADDPNYVSGLQIVIMLVVLIPASLRFTYGTLGLSGLLFALGILIYQPNLDTASARYSMQNILLAYVACFVIGFAVNRIRFTAFINNVRVKEKSEQLREQIEQVNALKVQQDGDYFLTANLIKPLVSNLVDHPNIEVDYLLIQKKKFKFRKWESEIGGDYISAHTITLKGESYTAFINGDAMGKSIQGAGGALVLGTVFRSAIKRTQTMSKAGNKHPENWLKECFVELQNVFASFDGTMLLSAALGLVNNKSGLLYYINAEHPWTVLYRNGRAEFIENELALRKIGFLESEGQMQVKIYQLAPGDVLVAGSDGRDDIMLGRDDQGNRILNEDETLFLKHVNAGEGRLPEIHKSLLGAGELTDDLSLLRIHYSGLSQKKQANSSPAFLQTMADANRSLLAEDQEQAVNLLEKAHALDPRNPAPLRDLVSLYGGVRLYALASEFSVALAMNSPAETSLLYQVAQLYKKDYIQNRERRSLEIAAEFGERFRIREPQEADNLANLADIYRLQKNFPRARMLLDLVFQMEPNHSKAKKLEVLLGSWAQ